MKLKWIQAPVKTQWGDEMVVASVEIDKDHTVCLYCERDQTAKVEAMFTQRTWAGLTDEERTEIRNRVQVYTSMDNIQYGLAIQHATETMIKEKNNV